MAAFVILAAVGVMIVGLGISIAKGNISLIHAYHRQQVTEENKSAYAKLTGAATIVCGAGGVLFGMLAALAEWTGQPAMMTAGMWLTIVCAAVGVVMFVYAAKKYHHGGS